MAEVSTPWEEQKTLTLWAMLLTYENNCPISDHSGWAPVVRSQTPTSPTIL